MTTELETILVIEPENNLREKAKNDLCEQGFQVIAADCWRNAMQLVESCNGQIDLIITDIIIPELNGRQLAKKFRGKSKGLCILFMSDEYPDDMNESKTEVCNASGQKTFSSSSLTQRVIDVLKRRKLSLQKK